MPYIVIEKFGGPDYATICTNADGENLVFTDYEAAQAEADDCQDGIIIEL